MLEARAAEAWASFALGAAIDLAERALRAGGGDVAREILARSALAIGNYGRALGALRGTDDPVLLRLRARMDLVLDAYDAAVMDLEAAQRHDRDGDPWAEAVLPAARAARDAEEPYATSGGSAELTFLEGLPLPVVRVRADTFETLALIGTGADLTVVDPALRDAGGTIDELTLGTLRVRDVPYITRSLDAISSAVGQQIGVVIGSDLLLRLHATIDGPRGRLLVHSAEPRRGPATFTLILTPGASSIAVPIRVGDRRAWMTLDTGGLFPLALAPGAAEAMGLEALDWVGTEAGPLATIPNLEIGQLAAADVPVIAEMLGPEHATAIGAPVSGSIGWMMLSQLTITLVAPTRPGRDGATRHHIGSLRFEE